MKLIILLTLCFSLLSCNQKQTIQTYSTPKPKIEQSHTTPSSSITWKKPSRWKKKASSGMRLAHFTVGQSTSIVNITLITLPKSGSLLSNINRWRGQLGLELIKEARETKEYQHLHLGPHHVNVVELVGETESITVGVIEQSHTQLFIKMFGPPDLVKKEKKALLKFIETVNFE